MMNLFSSFDPSSSNYLSMNWISMMICLILIPLNYWKTPSNLSQAFINIMTFIHKEIGENTSKNNMKIIMMMYMYMLFILTNNFMGLFPYIFTASSHMSLSLMMALPLWLSINIFGWMNKTNYMLAHLVPSGTPMLLSYFMVMIETISNIIRPITLSIRLSANMIAGHLLMTLLSEIPESMNKLLPMILMPLMILIILELAVAVIQSYVFTMLISLYISEIN
uniref:ATP synthase F0 subunit 6 n=1 Tax=Uroobovella oviformis TaxID=3106009 RepID=UPI002E772DC0|nr:ATP synthase F0 subunit 6 [Uroobovella oviformis]WPV72073.1 ATP synthase F0 subunit 6 [Uroobovella oviformis]